MAGQSEPLVATQIEPPDRLDWMPVRIGQDVNLTPCISRGEGVERLESTSTHDLMGTVPAWSYVT